MIYIKFHGGLGNQFFQYSYGRNLQKLLKDGVSYSFQTMEHEVERKKAIDFFNIDTSWKLIEYDKMLRDNRLRIAYYTLREKIEDRLRLNDIDCNLTKHYLTKQDVYFKKGIYVQNGHAYIQPAKPETQNCFVDGLWHTSIYCESIHSELLQELTLKDKSQLPTTLLKQIQSSEAVAVHIRRGDYLNYPYYIVTDIAYYKRAITIMRELHPHSVFFVFSDDISYVKDNLDEDVVYVDGNNPDYVDMELMRNCRHFIISNSTFSWWAAYLGRAENKTVMTPDKWYSDGRNKEWLNMPGWLVMPTGI